MIHISVYNFVPYHDVSVGGGGKPNIGKDNLFPSHQQNRKKFFCTFHSWFIPKTFEDQRTHKEIFCLQTECKQESFDRNIRVTNYLSGVVLMTNNIYHIILKKKR